MVSWLTPFDSHWLLVLQRDESSVSNRICLNERYHRLLWCSVLQGSKHLMAAFRNSSCSTGFQSPDTEFTLLMLWLDLVRTVLCPQHSVQGPSEVPKMRVAFYSHYSSFSHACSHPGSGRSFKRKCQNLIRERLLCFNSPRRPGKIIKKTAACSCRRLRGEGSRQDGKVNRKKEKCKRGTVHGNVKRKEMTDEGECESLVRSVTISLSAFVTSFNSDLQMIIFIAFMLFIASWWFTMKAWKSSQLDFFFNILVVVLYLKLFVYTKFLPAQLN